MFYILIYVVITEVYTSVQMHPAVNFRCFIHFTICTHISIKIKKNKLEENSCEYLTGYGKDKNFLSMKVQKISKEKIDKNILNKDDQYKYSPMCPLYEETLNQGAAN